MSALAAQANTDVYGPLVSRLAIEKAVITTLSEQPGNFPAPRIVFYLAEYERLYGLRVRSVVPPPGLTSYRGGIDHETWNDEEFPVLITVVKPDGAPESLDTARTYSQWFTVEVSATVIGQDEDEARYRADVYGLAISAAINQEATLGGIATRTTWEGFPQLDFPNPDDRGIIRSLSVFRTWVAPVLIGNDGPTNWNADPYDEAGDYPVVTEVNVGLTVNPIT